LALKTFSCPNCGANYNPAKYQCSYCGSYIFMSNERYTDFSNIRIEIPQKTNDENSKYPGIYVFGRLLGAGEKPLSLGAANYFTGLVSAGGKLLLTNKSLSFSAHAFNVGRQEMRIDLKQITSVKVSVNFHVSQQILVTTNNNKHRFVVYHGKEWVEKINTAIAKYDECEFFVSESQMDISEKQRNNYIQELQQLKQLLDSGVITEDEFNIKKRMLLGL